MLTRWNWNVRFAWRLFCARIASFDKTLHLEFGTHLNCSPRKCTFAWNVCVPEGICCWTGLHLRIATLNGVERYLFMRRVQGSGKPVYSTLIFSMRVTNALCRAFSASNNSFRRFRSSIRDGLAVVCTPANKPNELTRDERPIVWRSGQTVLIGAWGNKNWVYLVAHSQRTKFGQKFIPL